MAWPTMVLLLVLACGSEAVPPGSTGVPMTVLASNGPRIGAQTILAANDLETLRALVDTTAAVTVRQLGGTPSAHQCTPPYAVDHDDCWPGQTSRPGRAYVALEIEGGFCDGVTASRTYTVDRHLIVEVSFSTRSGCVVRGTKALPTASLVSFPTKGLRPGLYRVSFRLVNDNETYDSDSTYLSIPGPPASDQQTIDSAARAAVAIIIGGNRVDLFSLARVDGAQLGSLCGMTVSGPAYLATLDPDLSATHRQMSVILAGSTPHTCATTSV